jgi:hypothetical protein
VDVGVKWDDVITMPKGEVGLRIASKLEEGRISGIIMDRCVCGE